MVRARLGGGLAGVARIELLANVVKHLLELLRSYIRLAKDVGVCVSSRAVVRHAGKLWQHEEEQRQQARGEPGPSEILLTAIISLLTFFYPQCQHHKLLLRNG